MDTVEGSKGGKVFLTMFFRSCSLMLIFQMEEKTQDCVQRVFDSVLQLQEIAPDDVMLRPELLK